MSTSWLDKLKQTSKQVSKFVTPDHLLEGEEYEVLKFETLKTKFGEKLVIVVELSGAHQRVILPEKYTFLIEDICLMNGGIRSGKQIIAVYKGKVGKAHDIKVFAAEDRNSM